MQKDRIIYYSHHNPICFKHKGISQFQYNVSSVNNICDISQFVESCVSNAKLNYLPAIIILPKKDDLDNVKPSAVMSLPTMLSFDLKLC